MGICNLREKHTELEMEKKTRSIKSHMTNVIELPLNECKINNNHKSFNELYLSMISCNW